MALKQVEDRYNNMTPAERAQYQEALAERQRIAKRASKTKFTCPVCGLNAWAKPDARLMCYEHGVEMEDQ